MKWMMLSLLLLFCWGCANSNGNESTDSDTSDTDTEDTDTGDTETVDTETETFENMGLCGTLGQAIASVDSYQGTEERYLIADKGDGSDVCRVRVDLNYAGPPAVPCKTCEWAYVVEKSNVQIIADVDSGCANGYLHLDGDALAAIEGERVAIGYMPEYLGHIEVLMHYDSDEGEWTATGYVDWNSDTGELTYDMQDGWCGY